MKEVWRVPGIEPGRVYHTFGYPTGTREFGGGFIYTLTQEQVHVGFVVGLDSRDPREDAHRLLQEYKQHPFVRRLLEGGRVVSYGAKAIPEGGYHSMPRLYGNGLLLVGDSAGFLNPARLKGIHLAIESGMMAAEAAFEALVARDCSADRLKRYEELFQASEARKELHSARNFRQSFQRGFWTGLLYNGFQTLTGLGWGGVWKTVPGHERMVKMDGSGATGEAPFPGGRRPHLRQALRRLPLGYGTRGGSAQPPQDLGPGDLSRQVPAGIRQPLPAFLSGGRLRDGAGRGRAQAAGQLHQLCPLQDLRHPGSLSGDLVDSPRRGRRTGLQEHVSRRPAGGGRRQGNATKGVALRLFPHTSLQSKHGFDAQPKRQRQVDSSHDQQHGKRGHSIFPKRKKGTVYFSEHSSTEKGDSLFFRDAPEVESRKGLR